MKVTSADNRLKHVLASTSDDDDNDDVPLFYPFDANQVPFFICCLPAIFMFVISHCIIFNGLELN